MEIENTLITMTFCRFLIRRAELLLRWSQTEHWARSAGIFNLLRALRFYFHSFCQCAFVIHWVAYKVYCVLAIFNIFIKMCFCLWRFEKNVQIWILFHSLTFKLWALGRMMMMMLALDIISLTWNFIMLANSQRKVNLSYEEKTESLDSQEAHLPSRAN